jgi:DNA-directed RNA polymerase subunit alpha
MVKLYHHLSDTLKIKKISDDGKVGVFHVEGLYTGFGLTVGNALRRALFSSLPGAAVTQIKIKGVGHEFTTIPGVAEDVVELTLNLKKIRFKFFADEPQILTLKVKGEKEITADDIKTNAQVEIVNPDLHLATLTDKKAELDMELTIEKGLGYLPAAERKFERLAIGTVVLDAIFSPVIKVNSSVENMRVGERTDYNRLKIEIETDGSITPSDALRKTTNALKDHFDKISAGIETPEK